MTDENKKKAYNIISAYLLALICISFPAQWIFFASEWVAMAILRFVFSIVGIVLMIKSGGLKNLTLKIKRGSVDILLVGVIIAVNNFPLIPLINGEFTYNVGALKTFEFLLLCLSVGMFEELFFRGLLFTMFRNAFAKKRNGTFLALLASSALFGLTHLLNFFGGADIGSVLLQVGYSTLIGMLMSVVYYFCGSIIYPILLHALYNVGGLSATYLGTGVIWTSASVALTAVVSVLAIAWLCLRFFKREAKHAAEQAAIDSENKDKNIEVKKKEIYNMGEQKFFKCDVCGNFVGLINNGKAPMTCCGKVMSELVANTAEASHEKHIPKVDKSGRLVYAQIGEVMHPSTLEHHIEFIYLQTDDGGQRKSIAVGSDPKAMFMVLEGKPLEVYGYCNIHGLWKIGVHCDCGEHHSSDDCNCGSHNVKS